MSETRAKHGLISLYHRSKYLAKAQIPIVGIAYATIIAGSAHQDDVVFFPKLVVALWLGDNVVSFDAQGHFPAQGFELAYKALQLLSQHLVIGVSDLKQQKSHLANFRTPSGGPWPRKARRPRKGSASNVRSQNSTFTKVQGRVVSNLFSTMLSRLFLVNLWLVLALLSCVPATAQQRPAFDPLLQRAEAALAKKDLEQAVILYEKLANFYPESSLAHNRLGYAHYLRGNDPRAIYSFRTALSLNRNNDEALHNLLLASGRQADVMARENAFAEAARVLDELVATYSWHPQHAVLLYYRGRMEFLRGRPEEGLKWWKKASAQAPSSGVAKVIAAQSRPLDAATVKLYEEAMEKVKTESAFEYLLGMRQLEAQQLDNAYASFSKGLAKSKEANIPFPLLSIKTAQTALNMGRSEEAIAILEEAKKQRPDWASIRTLLWPAYLSSGNTTAADGALQEAFELDGRPMLCVLGAAEPVRLKTARGSLLLRPPTSLSLPPGQVTLTPGNGSPQNVDLAAGQALVFRAEAGNLSQVSSALLASNAGNAGQLAPPLVAKDRLGRLYRLAENLLKKPIVILFWDVSDSDASNQLTELGAIAIRFGENAETVAIHTDPKAQKDAQRLYLSLPSTSAQLWGDQSTTKDFGISEVPALVVVDKNGYITLNRGGSSTEMFNELADYIETLK